MPGSTLRPFRRTIKQSTLRLDFYDITALDVDVVVSSDDVGLSMGGSVARAIRGAGGESMEREARAWAPLPLGGVAVTTAGRMNARRVFHAAVLDPADRGATTVDLVTGVTARCLELCDQMGFRSIAFPALATGAARLSLEQSAVAMLIEIASHLRSPTNLRTVVLALYPRFAHVPRDLAPRFYSGL
ncbi:MAG: macro domain-containing protein [Longimicrobiaceae bacterium]